MTDPSPPPPPKPLDIEGWFDAPGRSPLEDTGANPERERRGDNPPSVDADEFLPVVEPLDEAAAADPVQPESLEIFDAPVPGVPLFPSPQRLADPPPVPAVAPAVRPAGPTVRPVAPASRPPELHPTPPDVSELPDARPIRVAVPTPPAAGAWPLRSDDAERPKPQVGLALVALFLLFLTVVAGLSVIGFAIWSGFRTLSKPRRADVPAPLIVRVDPGPLSGEPGA